MTVSLITCVTNGGGLGPGHSCVDVNGTIYTFEAIRDWGSNNSGWVQFTRRNYMSQNTHRPVITQRFSSCVSTGQVLNYIQASITGDDDYLTSGVCSSQAANAIEAGYQGTFNSWGIDTPVDIYQLAKSQRMVAHESMEWPGENDCNFFVRNACKVALVSMGAGAHL